MCVALENRVYIIGRDSLSLSPLSLSLFLPFDNHFFRGARNRCRRERKRERKRVSRRDGESAKWNLHFVSRRSLQADNKFSPCYRVMARRAFLFLFLLLVERNTCSAFCLFLFSRLIYIINGIKLLLTFIVLI